MSSNHLLRITQMNAIFLDKEIYKGLLDIVQDSTKHLPPGLIVPFQHEIDLIIRLAILKNSIWQNGSTFGQQLLSIKYSNMGSTRKVLYILGNCLDYIKDRFEYWNPSHRFNRIIYKVNLFLVLLNFINISIFLRYGAKPLLIERFLGLSQGYSTENAARHFDSKYLARELLWNGFIEILVNVLPLINYHKIKRTMRNYNPLHKRPTYTLINHNRTITMHSKCAHCNESPILPHHMGCVHVFCYVCLKGNQTADSKYECPVCEHRNPNSLCDRVSVM